PIEQQELLEVVATSDKKRFALQNGRIRANQGHSLAVELRLKVKEPPEYLYHGTAERFLESIRDSGLMKMARHHVHLSADVETARKVGQRHGRPVVLVVAALQMDADGYQFYLSENGVWLVDSVPWRYLELMPDASEIADADKGT
ncbi:MAG: RNA 2'-phosphotransferase, partial [Cyanobacteria bacterium J06641_5]